MSVLGAMIAVLGLIGIIAAPLMWVLGSQKRAKLALRNGFIALFVGLILAALGGGRDEGAATSTPKPAATPQSSEAPPSAPAAQQQPERKPDLEILEVSSEADQYSRYVVGKLRNNTDRTFNYVQVEINLYDGEGNVVGTTFDNVTNLEPGQTWKFKAVILDDSVKRFKIADISWF